MTTEYNERLHDRICAYLEDNGIDDFSGFALDNDGALDSESRIARWDYAAPQPNKSTIEQIDHVAARSRRIRRARAAEANIDSVAICRAPQMTSAEIEAFDPGAGLIVFNSNTRKLMYGDGSRWVMM